MIAQLHAWIAVWAMALLHFMWQGAVIAGLSMLVLRFLRGHAAQVRYLYACTALLLCLALPLLYLAQHAPLNATGVEQALNELGVLSSPFASTAVDASVPDASGTRTGIELGHGNWPWLQAMLPPLFVPLVALWLTGVMLLLLRMLLGLRWVAQQVQSASQHTNLQWQAHWQTCLQTMACAMGVHKAVRFGISTSLEFPVTAGCWRPMVILPAALLSRMPVELLEALLAHEVAHIKRCDYLVNLLQSLIETILFFHPAVWWLSRQIRHEREQIADDLAASLLGEPRRLALALSELERFQFTHPQLAQVAHGGNLMLRIKRLIQPAASGPSAGWKILVPSIALGATCIALYAQAHGFANTPATTTVPTSPVAALNSTHNADAHSTDAHNKHVKSNVIMTSDAYLPAVRKAEKGEQEANFALVKPDGKQSVVMHTKRDRSDEIENLRRQSKDEFLWFSEKGQSYWIKDKSIIDQANAAYQPLEDLGVQMDAHGKQMEQYGSVMEKLGEQMAQLAVNNAQFGLDKAFEAKMRAFEKKMQAFESKMEAAAEKVEKAQTAQARQQALSELAKQQEKLQQATAEWQKNEAQIQQHHERAQQAMQPTQELSKKMEEAAKPMEELGKQMEQLGKKMEALSTQAEKRVMELIQTAKQKGLAVPVTSKSSEGA